MKRLKYNPKLILLVFLGFVVLYSCQKEVLNPNRSIPDRHVVPEYFARTVAEKFNGDQFFKGSREAQPNSSTSGNRLLNISVEREIKNSFTIPDKNKKPAFYIFNYANGGFVFVSAEFTLQPILAYVPNGEVKRDTVPAGLVMWMEKTVENIEIVRDERYDNSKIGIAAWRDFIRKNEITVPLDVEVDLSSFARPLILSDNKYIVPLDPEPSCEDWVVTIKGPLVAATWGQGKTYNNLINLNVNYGCYQSGNDRPWTGCVATAMAQLIYYWKKPAIYDFNSMPLNSGNSEVQKLMFDAGKSVNMDWECEASGASPNAIAPALKSYFNYVSAVKEDFNVSHVIDNLSKGWPVLLGGCMDRTNLFLGIFYSYQECHRWVCDGYNEFISPCYGGYTYLHMNWGWHEAEGGSDYNGWFGYGVWYIPQNDYNFQYAQSAIINIHP